MGKEEKKYDLTVCIPTFNGSDTLQIALKALAVQSLELKVIIADNGSTDGTPEMVEAGIKNNWFKGLDVELHKVGRIEGGKHPNVLMVRKKLADLVKTKFMFWLDDDIKLPPHVMRFMLDEMLRHPETGALGVNYQPYNGHVAIGCVMMVTDCAKKIEWRYDNMPCECMATMKQIEKQDYKVMFMHTVTALDLNYLCK